MNEYMILIVAENGRNLRPEDEEACMTDYGKWAGEAGDKVVTGRRLDLSEGVLINKNKEMITDGPFAESKELIAGVVLIKEDSFDQAVRFATTCPLINYFNLFVKEVKN